MSPFHTRLTTENAHVDIDTGKKGSDRSFFMGGEKSKPCLSVLEETVQ